MKWLKNKAGDLYTQLAIRPKRSCGFPVPYPINKFLLKKIPTRKFFSALPTPNQRKTCIKHSFLTKKIVQFLKILPTYPYPIFVGTVTGKQTFFFLSLRPLLSSSSSFFEPWTYEPFGTWSTTPPPPPPLHYRWYLSKKKVAKSQIRKSSFVYAPVFQVKFSACNHKDDAIWWALGKSFWYTVQSIGHCK